MTPSEGRGSEDPVVGREELAAAYALGALEAAEREEAERSADADPSLQRSLEEHLATAALLAGAYQPVAPGPALAGRVLAAVRSQGHPVPAAGQGGGFVRFWGPRSWGVAAAVMLVVAVASLGSLAGYQQRQFVRLERDAQEMMDELQARRATDALEEQSLRQQDAMLATLDRELDEARAELTWARDQLRAQRAAVYWAAMPGKATVAVEMEDRPSARAMFMMSPDRQAGMFILLNFPDPPTGSVYEAWFFNDLGGAVSGGVLVPDHMGYAQLAVDLNPAIAASFRAVGLAVSPESGSGTPAMAEMLLWGTLEGAPQP